MSTKRTTIIYLIGKPGTSKYTITKEIAKYGYRICVEDVYAEYKLI